MIPEGAAIVDPFSVRVQSGRSVSYADDGEAIVHDEWEHVNYEIRFDIFPLTQSGFDHVMAYYVTNRYNSFEWTHPLTGATYNCKFLDAPEESGVFGLHLSASIRLIGTRV